MISSEQEDTHEMSLIHRKDRQSEDRGKGILVYERLNSNFITTEIKSCDDNINIELLSIKVQQKC